MFIRARSEQIQTKINRVGQECPTHGHGLTLPQSSRPPASCRSHRYPSARRHWSARLCLFYAGDDVGAAEPVGLGEVGLGPLGGVVGMGMVEADDVLFALTA